MFSSNTTQVSANAANYIEDVFSTYLYTGNDTGQTITNNIDLSTKGGLVWCKNRTAGNDHALFDTVRGVGKSLSSDYNGQQLIAPAGNEVSAFNTNGFTLGTDYNVYINRNTYPYASWTFRKQPKFFDVVTWTGNNADGRLISHSLGSTPGMVIIKNLTSTYNWVVWHKNLANPSNYLVLNSTAATATDIYGPFGSYSAGFTTNASCFTSTGFYVAADARSNLASNNYVAYLFADNAGGFGLTGTDNVISCGSFTVSAGAATVNLGYEPQWLLFKQTDAADNWRMFDNMRGWSMTANNFLFPNTAVAETASSGWGNPTATGFTIGSAANGTYIYIAIRRGPMKTPTVGTSVFLPALANDASPITTGFPVDMFIDIYRSGGQNQTLIDRLRGQSVYLATNTITAEAATGGTSTLDSNTSYLPYIFGTTTANFAFGRAPGFFDVVCYTGTGSATTVTHNLGVAPEMVIVKSRTDVYNWPTLVTAIGGNGFLFLAAAAGTYTISTYFNNTYPTSTVFSVGTNAQTNNSGSAFVAYLFATCAGVSKVGGYTGNGTTQTINCGFTGGARFVLIKRTDSTGDWYVYDTARGMTTLTDPYVLLNSNAAQVATLGSVTTVTTGFALNAAILAAINTSAATYIFLAIA